MRLHDAARKVFCTSKVSESQVRIKVADTDPGIPSDIQQNLFQPFFTTKPMGKGTGLGLSISYQVITEVHKGMFECHSTPGQGSEFMILIPIAQA
jgi:two-component system NtrC family sensor kinase